MPKILLAIIQEWKHDAFQVSQNWLVNWSQFWSFETRKDCKSTSGNWEIDLRKKKGIFALVTIETISSAQLLSFVWLFVIHVTLQHARLPCPLPTPRAYSNSYPSCQWCHPTISSSVVSFSSHLQSSPASGSFPTSQFFASDSKSIVVSALASGLPMRKLKLYLINIYLITCILNLFS